MCYMLYIACDIQIPVEKWQNEYMSVNTIEKDDEDIKKYFSGKNIYFLASKAGCSCDFRISMSREIGFSKPQDWYPESQEKILGTKLIYKLIDSLMRDNTMVELLPIWNHLQGEPIEKEQINIQHIEEEDFRLFENVMFLIKNDFA